MILTPTCFTIGKDMLHTVIFLFVGILFCVFMGKKTNYIGICGSNMTKGVQALDVLKILVNSWSVCHVSRTPSCPSLCGTTSLSCLARSNGSLRICTLKTLNVSLPPFLRQASVADSPPGDLHSIINAVPMSQCAGKSTLSTSVWLETDRPSRGETPPREPSKPKVWHLFKLSLKIHPHKPITSSTVLFLQHSSFKQMGGSIGAHKVSVLLS